MGFKGVPERNTSIGGSGEEITVIVIEITFKILWAFGILSERKLVLNKNAILV